MTGFVCGKGGIGKVTMLTLTLTRHGVRIQRAQRAAMTARIQPAASVPVSRHTPPQGVRQAPRHSRTRATRRDQPVG